MSHYRIVLIRGDGIGPEISSATVRVLEAVQEKTGLSLDIISADAGDGCAERTGRALPDETVDLIRSVDACLKGPVGETAMDVIVKLRQMLDLYVNLRPVKCYPNVESLRKDVDLVIVRENTEDLYRGYEFEFEDLAVALRLISRAASARIAEFAFKLAEWRNCRKSVVVVHKANVLRRTCGLFARVCREVAQRYPSIKMSEMYVDAAAMNLIRQPNRFDVILTTNMFGDILSDEAAQVVGGLGLAPSANIGEDSAIFEPVHGSAPDIAGRRVANPFSMILSAKMMFEWLASSKNDDLCQKAASLLEQSIVKILERDVKTIDLGGKYSTDMVADELIHEISSQQS